LRQVIRDKPLPILKTRPSDLASHALVVGDPKRVALAAELLTNPEEVGYFREYRTFTGEFAAKRVTISSHGVGEAGASVCFEELIQGGVKTIIRAGTCGVIWRHIHIRWELARKLIRRNTIPIGVSSKKV
jgi:uridine phosphorylase